MDRRDFMRKMLQKEEEAEEESLMGKEESYGDREQNHGPLPEMESTCRNQYAQVCQHRQAAAGLWETVCGPGAKASFHLTSLPILSFPHFFTSPSCPPGHRPLRYH